jgi:hypothetical protein
MEVKSLTFDITTKTPQKKEKTVRKETNKWRFDNKYLELDQQRLCLQAIHEKSPNATSEEVCRELRRQIQHKISSYKMQDIHKDKYDEDKFVDFYFVVSLLMQKELKCYYCKEAVYLFYNFVRENKQWTIERINNDFGHNRDNVEIACLLCNLRRRTMYHERYVFTKQLNVVKLKETNGFL